MYNIILICIVLLLLLNQFKDQEFKTQYENTLYPFIIQYYEY